VSVVAFDFFWFYINFFDSMYFQESALFCFSLSGAEHYVINFIRTLFHSCF